MLTCPEMNQTLAALQVANHYQIAKLVPLSGSVSFEELSTATKLDVDRLHRVLRMLMTSRIFTEPRQGHVAHTAASRILVKQNASDWLGHNLEEVFPSCANLATTFEKYEHSVEPDQSSAAVVLGKPLFDVYTAEPYRAKRFGGAMAWFSSSDAFDSNHMARAFDWAKLGRATVVDVSLSSCLARRLSQRITHRSVDLAVISALPSPSNFRTFPSSCKICQQSRQRQRLPSRPI